MSDIDSKVKQAETVVVSGWQKFVKGWLTFWGFVLKVIQEIVAPITDFQNHLDGYKIGGFLAFSGVAYLAFAAIGMADKGNIAGATVIGTFGTLLSGIGYFMFGHAKDVDKAQASQPTYSVSVSTPIPPKVVPTPFSQDQRGPVE